MEWTKQETDYLFGLCQRYDVRFVVIADRYDYPYAVRSIEVSYLNVILQDIKDRYFSVTRRILRLRQQNVPSELNFDKGLLKVTESRPRAKSQEAADFFFYPDQRGNS